MNLTRRTLAKVAAMLTLSGSIPAVAKALPDRPAAFEPDPQLCNRNMIGLMHYVEANTLFNGDMKLDHGYWATSYVDDLTEIPKWGDCFCHYPGLDLSLDDWLTFVERASYRDAMNDLLTEFIYGEQRYIRQRDGTLVNLGMAI